MVHEDYLKCADYAGHEAHPSEANFSAFQHPESQLYFFAVLDADGKTLLKSEGYPQVAARENGIQSVIKNRGNRDFYSVKQGESGRYHVSLRAANYREIARSCSTATEAEATALIPYLTGEQIRKAIVVEATTPAAAPAVAERANDRVDDDYLACHEYEGKPGVGAEYPGLVKFTHSNGKHYFAWYDDNGALLMRSEGYPTTSARDNGMASVAKNRDIEERYATMEKVQRYFTILKAANHQEIARSCGKDSGAAAAALYPSGRAAAAASLVAAAKAKADADAAKIAAAAAAAVVVPKAAERPSVSTPKVDVEDDYLTCKEYAGHLTAPRDGFRIFISERTNKYYFAVIDHDEHVSFRSEGHLTAADRDADLEDVVKNMLIKERYEIKQVGLDHYFIVLRNANKKEIARSCAYSSLAEVYAAAPFLAPPAPKVVPKVAPVAVAAAVAAIPKVEPKLVAPLVDEPAAGGFNWWWLLLPLLLLLGWWLLAGKGCNKAETVTVAPLPVPEMKPVVVDTVKAAPVVAAAPSCNLNWILFDFDKSDIRADADGELKEMATILKANKEYVAVLRAHTDGKGTPEYNEALSQRRAAAAKKALAAMGIPADRIKTEADGKNEPAAKNTVDDAGRRFNRRVELFVRDKAGKNVCQSIPPDIPGDLKAK